jgi:hypothetical protein
MLLGKEDANNLVQNATGQLLTTSRHVGILDEASGATLKHEKGCRIRKNVFPMASTMTPRNCVMKSFPRNVGTNACNQNRFIVASKQSRGKVSPGQKSLHMVTWESQTTSLPLRSSMSPYAAEPVPMAIAWAVSGGSQQSCSKESSFDFRTPRGLR